MDIINIRVPKRIKCKLKIMAIKCGKSLTALISGALVDLLETKKVNKKNDPDQLH